MDNVYVSYFELKQVTSRAYKLTYQSNVQSAAHQFYDNLLNISIICACALMFITTPELKHLSR